jgi:hypothetical protein
MSLAYRQAGDPKAPTVLLLLHGSPTSHLPLICFGI